MSKPTVRATILAAVAAIALVLTMFASTPAGAAPPRLDSGDITQGLRQVGVGNVKCQYKGNNKFRCGVSKHIWDGTRNSSKQSITMKRPVWGNPYTPTVTVSKKAASKGKKARICSTKYQGKSAKTVCRNDW